MLFEILAVCVTAVAAYWFIMTQIVAPYLNKTPSFPLFRKSSRANKAAVEEAVEQVETLRETVEAKTQLAELTEQHRLLQEQADKLSNKE
jgi:ABC-type bacteriocin/lantibiotic exporter with double-glycine peptidase domain